MVVTTGRYLRLTASATICQEYTSHPIHATKPIHTFSPVEHAVRSTFGDDFLSRIGRALTSEHEIIAATAELRDEVARAGRLLAERFGFAYPEAAEAAVRRTWQRFTAERD